MAAPLAGWMHSCIVLSRGVRAAGASGEWGPHGGCEAAGGARGAAGEQAEFCGAAKLGDRGIG